MEDKIIEATTLSENGKYKQAIKLLESVLKKIRTISGHFLNVRMLICHWTIINQRLNY